MFKIFRRNHIFRSFNNKFSSRFFSTQPQSKLSEVKFNKPENMSEVQEMKFYEDEFQKVYNDNRQRLIHIL
jgi:hypothetical protein